MESSATDRRVTTRSNTLVSESKNSTATKPVDVTKPTAVAPTVRHEVLPKETKYGIARMYGISIEELGKQKNPQKLKILTNWV
jgi:LysM repeat protein